MVSAVTTPSALGDSLDVVTASARIVREHEGVMPQLVDMVTLATGTGLDWREVSHAQLAATAVGATTVLDNAQQLSDTLFTITPQVIGLLTVITDQVKARISPLSWSKTGSLAQNAIQRRKDEDGLVILQSGTTFAGAGTTLTSGHCAAARSQISSSDTEPGNPPYRLVLHGFQIKDINDEITAGVGTYPVGEGLTARVFAEFFQGMIAGAQLYEAGNIVIDSNVDAPGGLFAREGIVLVQGRAARIAPVRDEGLGGGALKIYHYDEYAYGGRASFEWVKQILSDATAPTS